MTMKFRNLFLATTLTASFALAPSPALAQESVCEIIAQLAKSVGQARTDGLTKKQQQSVAKIALAQGGNKEIYKLHLSMVDNAYRNDLDAEEMSVIYYLACRKGGL